MEWDKMTEKRFIDGGEECIEDQFLIDTSNDKNYWVSDGLDGIVELLNELAEEKEQLKQQIHYLKIVCRNELDDETLKQVMGSLGDFE